MRAFKAKIITVLQYLQLPCTINQTNTTRINTIPIFPQGTNIFANPDAS